MLIWNARYVNCADCNWKYFFQINILWNPDSPNKLLNNNSSLWYLPQVLRKRRFQHQHDPPSSDSPVTEKKPPMYSTAVPKVVVIMARIHASDAPASFIIQVKILQCWSSRNIFQLEMRILFLDCNYANHFIYILVDVTVLLWKKTIFWMNFCSKGFDRFSDFFSRSCRVIAHSHHLQDLASHEPRRSFHGKYAMQSGNKTT